MSDLQISIIVPVRNEERFIRDTLDQLRDQEYPAELIEILVCDGESDDRTREIVQGIAAADPRVRLLENPARRSSSGRNVGFRAARGDVMLVVDGHVRIPDRGLLKAIAECFERSGADCLGRPQTLIAEAGGEWSTAIAEARASPLGHATGSLIYSDYEGPAPAASNGAAYRRRVFETIGYVDETFDACEDLEFNTRVDKAGLSCYSSPRLTVQYFARNSPRALFWQLYRYGFGRFKYVRRHPDRLSLAQLLPPALVLGLLGLPVAALISRPLAVAGAACALLWMLSILAASLALGFKISIARTPRYAVVLAIVHLAVGCGFLASMLRGGRVRRFARPSGEAA